MTHKHRNAIVIGAGFAGIAVATSLAQKGYDVTVIEKNTQIGGRARQFHCQGFTFDMGPSWYWMPDIFENYFRTFGKKPSDYYQLKRLDPSYSVVFGADDRWRIPANLQELGVLLEQYEAGAAEQLEKFMAQAKYKYEVGINDFVNKPSRSITEFLDIRLLKGALNLDLLTSLSKHVRKFFKHPQIIKLLEFPVLFLGATPENTPALYSLMNYADLKLGTWYPMGGMFEIIRGMETLAREMGVKFHTGETVSQIEVKNGIATGVNTDKDYYPADIVVGGADYHHVEQHLLPTQYRSYSPQYWQKRTMAPSALLFYIGLDKKLEGIDHHMLFFDEDFKLHASEIYTNPQWPSKPLFYMSAASVTDPAIAPEGKENLVLLVPLAPGLEDSEEKRSHYYEIIMNRLEKLIGQSVKDHVIVKKSYAIKDFEQDYNAFKGNAYGLANTLKQTAILKPSCKSKKVANLYYVGQLTIPGPGVPPSLISGLVVGNEIEKDFAEL
ncbi:NAD(P)/FAD-dependent oxidoreductase [Persicobacter sp. CCB-QB2]|uniref:phytoene desaturase family protein n=1 Tax=Persicobacter sp. CCB-QB2 TaxID=1561025 RepID=UPI0006A9986E|nr:phytoene desaturase family protein [Persicobacter sp. CCB-QB2]